MMFGAKKPNYEQAHVSERLCDPGIIKILADRG